MTTCLRSNYAIHLEHNLNQAFRRKQKVDMYIMFLHILLGILNDYFFWFYCKSKNKPEIKALL